MRQVAVLVAAIFLFSCQMSPMSIRPAGHSLLKTHNIDTSFYKKYIKVRGVPIVASEKVSNMAMDEAAYLMSIMLKDQPQTVLDRLVKSRVRVIIIGNTEFSSDIPEYKKMAKKAGKDYFDWRSRGVGTYDRRHPTVSCGEEDILEYEGSNNSESIFIHEFAHTMQMLGLGKEFNMKLRKVFMNAKKKGLWQDAILDGEKRPAYAMVDMREYWAEGVQSWFDTNRTNDHDHNHVDTRQELKDYDKELAQLVEEVYGDGDWKFVSPKKRAGQGHLKNFNPETAPKHVIPQRLVDVRTAYFEKLRKEKAAK